MKFFYPKDKQGNPISFRTLESQVFDKDGKCLTDKLAEIEKSLNISISTGTTVSPATIEERE